MPHAEQEEMTAFEQEANQRYNTFKHSLHNATDNRESITAAQNVITHLLSQPEELSRYNNRHLQTTLLATLEALGKKVGEAPDSAPMQDTAVIHALHFLKKEMMMPQHHTMQGSASILRAIDLFLPAHCTVKEETTLSQKDVEHLSQFAQRTHTIEHHAQMGKEVVERIAAYQMEHGEEKRREHILPDKHLNTAHDQIRRHASKEYSEDEMRELYTQMQVLHELQFCTSFMKMTKFAYTSIEVTLPDGLSAHGIQTLYHEHRIGHRPLSEGFSRAELLDCFFTTINELLKHSDDHGIDLFAQDYLSSLCTTPDSYLDCAMKTEEGKARLQTSLDLFFKTLLNRSSSAIESYYAMYNVFQYNNTLSGREVIVNHFFNYLIEQGNINKVLDILSSIESNEVLSNIFKNLLDSRTIENVSEIVFKHIDTIDRMQANRLLSVFMQTIILNFPQSFSTDIYTREEGRDTYDRLFNGDSFYRSSSMTSMESTRESDHTNRPSNHLSDVSLGDSEYRTTVSSYSSTEMLSPMTCTKNTSLISGALMAIGITVGAIIGGIPAAVLGAIGGAIGGGVTAGFTVPVIGAIPGALAGAGLGGLAGWIAGTAVAGAYLCSELFEADKEPPRPSIIDSHSSGTNENKENAARQLLKEIQHMIEKTTWSTGSPIGGERITFNEGQTKTVPHTIAAIHRYLYQNQDQGSALEQLATIQRTAKTAHRTHSFLRGSETQAFYALLEKIDLRPESRPSSGSYVCARLTPRGSGMHDEIDPVLPTANA